MILEWRILQSELAWPPQRVYRLVKSQAVIHQLAMLAEDQWMMVAILQRPVLAEDQWW